VLVFLYGVGTVKSKARQAGAPAPTAEAVAEFRSYWIGQGAAMTQHAWDHKLLTNLKSQKLRRLKMCDYQGYEFGAGSYPDSVCIDARLALDDQPQVEGGGA